MGRLLRSVKNGRGRLAPCAQAAMVLHPSTRAVEGTVKRKSLKAAALTNQVVSHHASLLQLTSSHASHREHITSWQAIYWHAQN